MAQDEKGIKDIITSPDGCVPNFMVIQLETFNSNTRNIKLMVALHEKAGGHQVIRLHPVRTI